MLRKGVKGCGIVLLVTTIMSNYMLKFKHSNGSNVWFTVYCGVQDIWCVASKIQERTSYKFLDDYTDLGA